MVVFTTPAKTLSAILQLAGDEFELAVYTLQHGKGRVLRRVGCAESVADSFIVEG